MFDKFAHARLAKLQPLNFGILFTDAAIHRSTANCSQSVLRVMVTLPQIR